MTTIPLGAGTCPTDDAPERVEFVRCNTHVCQPQNNATGVLECMGSLDVVLILDGGTSVGSEGWDATKQAAQLLVQAFKSEGNASNEVAALVFSGPDTWDDYSRCTGGNETGLDVAGVCRVSWLSRFTSDTASVASSIGGLAWPRGTSLTSLALAMTEAELFYARPAKETVVIVITDGKPMNRRKTFQASESLRKKARLIWVPVTADAPLSDIKEWASKPAADNIVELNSYDDLPQPANLNRIIADACPQVL